MTNVERVIRQAAETVLAEILSSASAREAASEIAKRASQAVINLVLDSLTKSAAGRPPKAAEHDISTDKPEPEKT